MLDTRKKATDALVRAMSDALTNGLTTDDIDEIAQMVAAEQPPNLDDLAKHMGEDSERDELPIYAEAPPGMIDIATAAKVHGLNAGTVRGWIHRGVLPPVGKVRGLGGTRFLVCEETIARMAKEPKNKGGRPRKTGRDYIGIEKSRPYCAITRRRLEPTHPVETPSLPPTFSAVSCPDPVQVTGNVRLVYDRIRGEILATDQPEVVLSLRDVAEDLGLSLRTVERATAQLKAAGHIDVVNHGRWAGYKLPPPWVGGTLAASGQQTPSVGGTTLNGGGRPELPVDEIDTMIEAQQPLTLAELAKHMAQDSASDELPVYDEAPSGMIDIDTAVKQHGVKAGTVKAWLHLGVVPVLGKVRGLGRPRVLVCEDTLIKIAKMPKNKGGRPSITPNPIAKRLVEESERDELPVYTEAPPGMIDLVTAETEHGVKTGTVKGWIHRGVVPVLGKVRGIRGHRILVCEETLVKMANMPKNKGGRPRKT